jgi:hypothetical protein
MAQGANRDETAAARKVLFSGALGVTERKEGDIP